jgi:hypothetical protein
MRNQRIVFLVILIIAAALVTGYWIGRAPQLDALSNAVSAKSPPKTANVKGGAYAKNRCVQRNETIRLIGKQNIADAERCVRRPQK